MAWKGVSGCLSSECDRGAQDKDENTSTTAHSGYVHKVKICSLRLNVISLNSFVTLNRLKTSHAKQLRFNTIFIPKHSQMDHQTPQTVWMPQLA
jgi:hypothetical protein